MDGLTGVTCPAVTTEGSVEVQKDSILFPRHVVAEVIVFLVSVQAPLQGFGFFFFFFSVQNADF